MVRRNDYETVLQYICPCSSVWTEHLTSNQGAVGSNPTRGAHKLRERNRQYVWDHLLLNPCVDCGEANPLALTFDHVRGTKVDKISSCINRRFSIKRLQEEIDKCEVRCANCHTIQSYYRTERTHAQVREYPEEKVDTEV